MFCNQHRCAPGRESGGLREIHTPQSGKMKDLVELIRFLGGPLQHPLFFLAFRATDLMLSLCFSLAMESTRYSQWLLYDFVSFFSETQD